MSLTSRQKTKTATNLTINYLIIPLLAATGIYFLIDNIKLPDVISKNLWIVAVAVIGSVAICLYVFIKGMYYLYYKIPTIKSPDATPDETIDYHNIIYLIMSALLAILFIAVLIRNHL